MTSCPAPFHLTGDLLAAAARWPDKPALEILHPDRAEIWRYADLTAAILGGAHLLAQTAPPGARVLLRLGNEPAFPVAFLAAITAGLVPIPSSPQLTRAEITKSAAILDPALVIAEPGIALPDHPAPILTQAALLDAASGPQHAPEPGDPNRLAYIVQTSGTSGTPRFVQHAHRAVWARRRMHQGWEGLGAGDRLLHAGAFNWTYTLGTGLLDPWATGATALIPAPGTTPETLGALLARHRATIFAAAPGIYRKMLRAGLPPMPTLRHGLSAGEKLPEETRSAWQEATGLQIHEAYGQSEISTFISGSPDRPAPPGTLGFPQPGRRVALLDAAGEEVPAGESGEIAIDAADPGVMLGYLDAPRPTGPWLRTGDWGRLTPEGAVIYEGRHDDLINAGGLRVSPMEIEAALTAFPGIDEAAAVALPLRADTEVIGAFYTSAAPLDEAALADHLADQLAAYKRPRVLERLDALPRGANNKLNRRALRRDWSAVHDFS